METREAITNKHFVSQKKKITVKKKLRRPQGRPGKID